MANKDSQKIWFISGASSGLGLEIGLAALRSGHQVIGTGRNIQSAAIANPEFEKLGGRWLQLDISRPEAQDIVTNVVAEQARNLHWVVVNNAGNTLLGAVEDMSEDQISQYLQPNVFGAIRIWKALLPVLRRNRRGTLVTISSIFGFVSKAEHMMYSAVKATTESLTESYAGLLAPFGIKAMIIEPGGFRTRFPANNIKADRGISADYKEAISKWIDIVDAAGKDPMMVNGDPKRLGARVVDAVEGSGPCQGLWSEHEEGQVLRVQLGTDCYDLFGEKLKRLNQDYEKMASIAQSTDADP
ncbi:uncharacterized protein A1O9_12887 [Exophiala aquamarina CBS 119918]|uniref:Oxidoreductase n=1 Tax=Exophiala aquamarina CBS 119918 TaxID=1182545 RepID=A0A072NTS8_9EURO|nr:uncharacterized protein A1O9_12887 [Exophiala aquamarina CBS 119918]KEF51071.1 hypothetical protein A1O9_12887 [Exophiala aquamarina CBS 119918]